MYVNELHQQIEGAVKEKSFYQPAKGPKTSSGSIFGTRQK
jgi:hypothetical protein